MYSANETPYWFKTFLIGKKGVGRSTFAKSPYFSSFTDNDLTIGTYFCSYDHSFDSSNKYNYIKLQIWFYNPERFKEMFHYYLHGSNA